MTLRRTCKNGHPFTQENTMVVGVAALRRCKVCHRAYAARYRRDHRKSPGAPAGSGHGGPQGAYRNTVLQERRG